MFVAAALAAAAASLSVASSALTDMSATERWNGDESEPMGASKCVFKKGAAVRGILQ